MYVATAKLFDVARKKSPKSVTLQRCSWGITITQSSYKIDVAEAMLRILGTTFLCVSSLLILPIIWGLAFADSSEGLLGESLAVFTIAASGFALRQFGLLGVRKQLQVDSKRGEVRFGYLRSDRQFRHSICIPQSDILSAFLFRSKSRTLPARLVFRLRSISVPLVVFKGPEFELKPALDEIIDMANQTSPRRIRSRTTDRLLHVRFDQ